jgi:hypothetical protein
VVRELTQKMSQLILGRCGLQPPKTRSIITKIKADLLSKNFEAVQAVAEDNTSSRTQQHF